MNVDISDARELEQVLVSIDNLLDSIKVKWDALPPAEELHEHIRAADDLRNCLLESEKLMQDFPAADLLDDQRHAAGDLLSSLQDADQLMPTS